jgi:hypothetical protein
MKIELAFCAVLLAAALGGAAAQSPVIIPAPGDEIVLTDPLVRVIQAGVTPVGAVRAYDPRTGVGLVAVPGIGMRQAALVGVAVPWAGQPAVGAVDLATGVNFIAILPTPPQLIPAKVVRSIGDSILVRRDLPEARVTEAVPVGSVFAASHGGLAPATRVVGALQPGSTVLIPPDGDQRARVIVQKVASSRSRMTRHPSRTARREHRRSSS